MEHKIDLLGRFQVRVGNRLIPDRAWRHRRAAELVKLLGLTYERRLHREQLMDALWPDLSPEAAGANLRKAVYFARQALGEASVVTAREMVELWPDEAAEVDARLFEAAARSALARNDCGAAAEAAALYSGDLLPEDRYAAWADEPRERLRALALQVMKAASLWERVLDIDPADEEAHRALMQRALDAGDRGGAIRQFERLRERLRTELGIGPETSSVALYEKAIAVGGERPPRASERIRSLLAWGLVQLNSGDLDQAERSAEGARSLAIEANLGPEMGEASALLGIVANMRGRWKELFRAEFVASVRRTPHLAPFVFDAHLCLAEFCLSGPTGHEEIVGYALELLEVAEETSSIHGAALAQLLLGEAALFSDRLPDAESHLSAARDLHEEAKAVSGQVISLQRLAETAVARGRRWHADRLARRGLRMSENTALAPHLVVRMHGSLLDSARDEAAALAAIEVAETDLVGAVVCPPCSIGFKVAATIALARAGRLDQARKRLEEAERLSGMWPGGPWHAAVWEARGALRAAEGNAEQSAALFREAAERFAALGRVRDEGRCRDAAAAPVLDQGKG